MRDDAFNVHATCLLITEIIKSTTAIVKATNGMTLLDVGVGTNVEFTYTCQTWNTTLLLNIKSTGNNQFVVSVKNSDSLITN